MLRSILQTLMSRKRRILSATIKFISLCEAGANGLSTIYKSTGKDSGQVTFTGYTAKLANFAERGEIVACVYPANRLDEDDEWADASAVRKMAHNFLKSKGSVDMRHNEDPLKDAHIVESFIIQKGDERFAKMTDSKGTLVDVTDGWGTVIKLDSEDLRKRYRNGEFDGVSMGGVATVREEDPPSERTRKALASIVIEKEEIDMNAKELEALLEKNNEKVVETLEKSIDEKLAAAGIKPVEKGTVTEVEDEGFPDDLDLDDEVEVNKYLYGQEVEESMAKVKKAKDKRAELKKHFERVAKLKKSYGIDDENPEGPAASVAGADGGATEITVKQSNDEWAYGAECAKQINKERGTDKGNAKDPLDVQLVGV